MDTLIDVGPVEIEVESPTVEVVASEFAIDIDADGAISVSGVDTDIEVEVTEAAVETTELIVDLRDSTGATGATGPQGVPGNTATKMAAVSLSGRRAVAFDASGNLIYADETLLIPCEAFIRDAIGAAASGTTYFSGSEINGFTGLTIGAEYFLDASGQISTTPGSNLYQYIGVATAADTLLFEPGEAILFE